jgi:hypothetical protein
MGTDKRKTRDGMVINSLGAASNVYLYQGNQKARELQLAQEALENAIKKLEQEQKSPNPRQRVIENCERIIADKKAFLESR